MPLQTATRTVPPRVRLYAREAATRHNVSPDIILSDSRARKGIPEARGEVMRRLRGDGFSVAQIGHWLGRDHSTVVYWTCPYYRARRMRGWRR